MLEVNDDADIKELINRLNEVIVFLNRRFPEVRQHECSSDVSVWETKYQDVIPRILKDEGWCLGKCENDEEE